MNCNNCGNPVEPFNKFCPKCGAPVQPPSPPMGPGPSYTPPGPSYAPPVMGGPPVQPARKSSCGKIILIVGIILVLLAAGIAAAVYFGYRFVENTLKTSEPYTIAVNTLKSDPQVKEQLGEITETGFPLGAYSTNADGTGDAAFTMSVTGTKGSGQYQVELKRRNSVWEIENGFVRLTNGAIIVVGGKSREEDADEANSNTDFGSPDEIDTSDAINGGILNGKAISLPKPAYPQIAKSVKASGMVVIQVLVDEKGDVISARPASGHPLLQASAVVAARQAKFPPTRRGGQAVKVRGIIQYTFTPDQE